MQKCTALVSSSLVCAFFALHQKVLNHAAKEHNIQQVARHSRSCQHSLACFFMPRVPSLLSAQNWLTRSGLSGLACGMTWLVMQMPPPAEVAYSGMLGECSPPSCKEHL